MWCLFRVFASCFHALLRTLGSCCTLAVNATNGMSEHRTSERRATSAVAPRRNVSPVHAQTRTTKEPSGRPRSSAEEDSCSPSAIMTVGAPRIADRTYQRQQNASRRAIADYRVHLPIWCCGGKEAQGTCSRGKAPQSIATVQCELGVFGRLRRAGSQSLHRQGGNSERTREGTRAPRLLHKGAMNAGRRV